MPSTAACLALRSTALRSKALELAGQAKIYVHLLQDPHLVSNDMTFSDIINLCGSFRRLVPLFNGGKGPILYSCSCAQFHQYFFCPDVLAHAINEKELVVPIDRQIAVIGRSGKAGRPKKATIGAALVRDAELCAVNNRAKRGTASQQVGSRQSTASANGSRSHRLPSEELQPSQLSRRGMQSQPPP
jgi:hypothetical protein